MWQFSCERVHSRTSEHSTRSGSDPPAHSHAGSPDASWQNGKDSAVQPIDSTGQFGTVPSQGETLMA
eukprot:3150104-Rhodomonas_salina.2